MLASRYVVGIDLGTTNSALAFAETGGSVTQLLPIPQVVQPGQVEERLLLPSFLYLPRPGEVPTGSLRLPWAADRDYAVGEYARRQGSQVETRLVASAKSWLCHPGVDRRAAILPFKAGEGDRRISPVEASTLYLRHLVEAWNASFPSDPLPAQEILLTVPASFDAVARELTVEAAQAAGLEHLTLLEEPQAAFYAWLDQQGDAWRDQVRVGDVILICDVGGGTTDLSLIAVEEEDGRLMLRRVAVGDHILLGGDNMDLTLAYFLAKKLGSKLDLGQMLLLRHAAREAKEALLTDYSKSSVPITVVGRGTKLIGGTLRTELTRDELTAQLLDGFFPSVGADAVPRAAHLAGFAEMGLPYASDPSLTAHLAYFLRRHANDLSKSRQGPPQPTAVLFNGGVFKAEAFQQRVIDALNRWSAGHAQPIKVLPSADLDLAVAKGAAYYGQVRHGKGVRIRGGTSRSYYIGIETARPAVPGVPPPFKALCVVPFGMEEGTETDVPGHESFLLVNTPAEFRFLGSTVRQSDPVGLMLEEWDEHQLEEMAPLSTTLVDPTGATHYIPVRLHSKVTEIGILELWCLSRDGQQRWKLEFNIRDKR
ncbi:MAG: Hsp70 family protein [Gemmataceae bacterium]